MSGERLQNLFMACSATLALVYMIGLFVLSSIPGPAQPGDSLLGRLVAQTPVSIQKLMHVLLYGGLAWLWFWTLEPLKNEPATRWLLAFLLTAGYGAFNEWYQLHVPGRFGSCNDILLNSIGAIIGLLMAAWLT